uniref:Ku domain-containing protein n=1 Tax=Glossina pallidipes TaxID=7398 RepID=A0A1B0A2P6_GLOPL
MPDFCALFFPVRQLTKGVIDLYFISTVLLRRSDNAIVKGKRLCKIDPETNKPEDPRAVNITIAWREMRLSDRSLRLTYEQANGVRNLHIPGMMLLGFQSKIVYCKPCNFTFSDDRSVSREDATKGSYYSLLPKDGVKVVYLPYTSYVRHVDFKKWNSLENRASDEGVAICEKLVRKLRLKYNPNLLSDPEMDRSQYFPDPQSQDTVISRLLLEFEETFGEDTEPAQKRAASYSSLASTKSKAPKLVVENLNKKYYVIQMMNNRALDSCTNQ